MADSIGKALLCTIPPGRNGFRLRPGQIGVGIRGDMVVPWVVRGAGTEIGGGSDRAEVDRSSSWPVSRVKASPATRARAGSRILSKSQGTRAGSPSRPTAMTASRRVSGFRASAVARFGPGRGHLSQGYLQGRFRKGSCRSDKVWQKLQGLGIAAQSGGPGRGKAHRLVVRR
jgi:hypothetical protein